MTDQGSGQVKDKPSGAKRAIPIVVAVLVVVVLPVVLMDALVGKFGASAMIMGLLLGVLGSMIGGTRPMLYLAPAMGVAAGLGSFTAYNWWWVALLAILGLVAGAGMRFGWFAPLLMLPFVATFASPVTSGRDAVAYGVIAGIATLYGVVLARRFKAPNVVEGQRSSPPAAAAVGIGLGIALGGTAAIGVALGWTEPYWVPEPVLILTLYVIMGKRERIREKALATFVGVIAAVPVAIVGPPPWAITVLADRGVRPSAHPVQEELLGLLQLSHVCDRSGSLPTRRRWHRGRPSRHGNPRWHRNSRCRSGRSAGPWPLASQALPRARARRVACALVPSAPTSH